MFPSDIDFNAIIGLNPDGATIDSTASNSELGMSLKFDYETKRFILVDGTNVIPSKIDAIKQWIELFIRTEVLKYEVYTDEFGIDTSDILGYRLPRGYKIAEIRRRTTEGILAKCPMVSDIRDWSFDMGHFEFTVITNTGEEVRFSV